MGGIAAFLELNEASSNSIRTIPSPVLTPGDDPLDF
jgi:hypothetical protein